MVTCFSPARPSVRRPGLLGRAVAVGAWIVSPETKPHPVEFALDGKCGRVVLPEQVGAPLQDGGEQLFGFLEAPALDKQCCEVMMGTKRQVILWAGLVSHDGEDFPERCLCGLVVLHRSAGQSRLVPDLQNR
jgi:hypothetical protein